MTPSRTRNAYPTTSSRRSLDSRPSIPPVLYEPPLSIAQSSPPNLGQEDEDSKELAKTNLVENIMPESASESVDPNPEVTTVARL